MSEIRSVSQVSRLTSIEDAHTTSMSETNRRAQVSWSKAAAASRTEPRQIRSRRRLVVLALRVLLLVVIIGGWELGTRVGFIDPFFWGQPSEVWKQIVTWVTQGTAQGPLWQQILVTLEETVIGFVIGVILGIIAGVILGRNRFLSDVLSPYIKAANSIPRVVLGSIFVIGLGLGMQSKLALAVVLVFFIVFFNAFQGVREVDRNLLANARILGANQRQLSTAVIIPSALTWIIASLHTSFSFALVGAVVGEFLGSTQGLGLLIQTAQGTFNANGVFAAMTILAAVALLSEFMITALEKRLLHWRPNTVSDVTI
jgi:NitT/TauT family transport system permease protein